MASKQQDGGEENRNESTDKLKGRLTESTISYFKRVEQVLLEDAFDDDDHKETFLRNVYSQIEEDTTQLLRHTLTSKVLEEIIPLFNEELFSRLLLFLKEDLPMLCSDRFASHVIETVCNAVKTFINSEAVVASFVKLCKGLRGKLDVLLRDVFGSHVVSTLLQVFSGVQVSENITRSRNARESKKKSKKKKTKYVDRSLKEVAIMEVPKEFIKQLNKFSDEIIADDNFGELLCHRNASPVLQVLLLTTSKTSSKRYQAASQQILLRANVLNIAVNSDDVEDEETMHKLPVMLTDAVGSHLFEVLLQSADEKLFNELASKCFSKIIISLSLHSVGNYLVQIFLSLIKDDEKANIIVDKLLLYIEDILANGHMGCVARLSEIIARLNLLEQQKKFINVISEALHIPKDCTNKPLTKLLLSLLTFDVFFKASLMEGDEKNSISEEEHLLTASSINNHGASILKNCLLFKKSKDIVDSFLMLTLQELTAVACHPNGSFAFESFYLSEYIPLKKKNELTQMFLSQIDLIANEKFGSRVVDAMWTVSTTEMRDKLQASLRVHKSKLSGSLFGRIVLCNCEVTNSLKQRENMEREIKKRKFVAAIVPDAMKADESPTTDFVYKKKKKKDDDRASKYREQLKLLGISFESENQPAG